MKKEKVEKEYTIRKYSKDFVVISLVFLYLIVIVGDGISKQADINDIILSALNEALRLGEVWRGSEVVITRRS